MHRALLIALAIGCHREPPPPPAPGAPGDLRFVPPVYSDAAAVTVTLPNYRVPGKLLDEDTTVTASSKTRMIVTEREVASKIGRDVLAAGGTAADAAIASAFALAVVHPAAVGIGGGGFAMVRTAPGTAIAVDFRGTGLVAGLAELHGKHGKKPWRDLVAPAIALAREGFAIDRRTAMLLGEAKDRLEASPASAAIWLVGGAVRDEGAKVVLAELSATLEKIANDPKAMPGPVVTDDPLRFTYRGHSVATMSRGGGALLGTFAGMLGGVDLGSFAWHGKDHVHWLVETWKRAFAIGRLVPPAPLLAQQVASITDKASEAPAATLAFDGDLASPIAIVDRSGLAIAMTLTLGAPFGTGETAPGGYLRARAPAADAPSLMAPHVVENAKGELVLVGGAGGAHESVTAAWQVLSNAIDFAHRGSLAVNNPRVHHQQLPDTVFVEDYSIDSDTETKLVEQGHAIDWNRPAREFGIAAAIVRTKTGWDGAADARGGGKALGD